MSALEDVTIARPCPADWNAMTGDDCVRFCNLCQLNVYNLSGMKREDAEALLAAREGRVCVRLYKRADGTVITQDCPKGLAALRRRVASIAAGIAAFLALGWTAIAGRGSDEPSGSLVEKPAITTCRPVTGRVQTPAHVEPPARVLRGAPPVRVEQGGMTARDPEETR